MPFDTEDPRLIYQSDFWSIYPTDSEGIIRVVRHGEPFRSEAHCRDVTQPVQDVLDSCGRETLLLLVDSRQAPLRSDPQYEQWFASQRDQIVFGFERAAILMRSIAGVLQAKRLTASAVPAPPADRVQAFVSEAEARAFLLG